MPKRRAMNQMFIARRLAFSSLRSVSAPPVFRAWPSLLLSVYPVPIPAICHVNTVNVFFERNHCPTVSSQLLAKSSRDAHSSIKRREYALR